MLTWAQVEPALPKVGQAAQVDAWALAEGHMKEISANPDQVLLPQSEWPARFEQTRVLIQNDEEWDKLCTGLWARGVIRPMDDSEVIRDQHGMSLAGGLFGIGKGKFIQDAPVQELQEVLRLICNFPPSNAVQIKVEGDVGGLPYQGNWQFISVGNESTFFWHSEDMVSSFWLFFLPKVWGKLFMISKLARGSIFGLAEDLVKICLTVIPMGWISAVGIVQYLHRRLVKLTESIPQHLELRRDGPAPTDLNFNMSEFYEVYVDNLDGGESATDDPARRWMTIQPSNLQKWILAVRSTGERLGVIYAEDEKRVQGAWLGQTLGAEVDGKKKEIRPLVCRSLELMGQTLWLPPRRQVTKDLEVLCGCLNVVQFRRQIAGSLDTLWDALFESTPGDARWIIAFDNLLRLMVLTPLAVNKLDHDTDPVVTASDASERGAGVVASCGLTSAGFARLAEAEEAIDTGVCDQFVLFD